MTSAALNVPDRSPFVAGQAGVPAGPLPRLLHRKTEMPPLTAGCPKWMWDWVTLTTLRYESRQETVWPSISARKVPRAVVDTAGTSL
jgi:hypothetical protein